MQAKPWLYTSLLLMAALIALYFFFSRSQHATATVLHQPADAWLADARPLRRTTPQNSPHVALPVTAAGVPLANQVDLLIASGAPEDALRAYWLVQACVDIAESGVMLTRDSNSPTFLRAPTDDERAAQTALCAGMTERIKTSRLDHLAIAARAGVSGADDAFLRVGPFGDRSALKTRPDDPLVKAWRNEAEQLLTTHAEAGDVSSMLTLMQEYGGEGHTLDADPALALRYTVAVGDIFERMLSRSGPGFANPYKSEVERATAVTMTPEQRAQAIAAGKEMAEKAALLQARNRTATH
nr:hypothetical protein [uncultured Duganella sp.]